jgi:hypothetical protein
MRNEVELSLARAIDFLGRQQDRSGAWFDFALGTGYGSSWPTAFVGYQLAHLNQEQPLYYAASAQLARARLWLLSNLTSNGGWGFSERLPEDADSTALGLLFLGALQSPERSAVTHRAVESIYQAENGGVSTYHPQTIRQAVGTPFFPGEPSEFIGWMSPVPSVTAAMGLVWRQVTGFDSHRQRAVQYLLERQQPEGHWSDYWWLQPYYPTYMVIEVLAGLDGTEEALHRAGEWLTARQSSDGGWPYEPVTCNAFATALAVSSLLRLGGAAWSEIERGVRWLVDHQNADGSFPPGAMMTVPPPETVTPPSGIARLFLPNVLDDRRLFTTAAAVRALAEFHHGGSSLT